MDKKKRNIQNGCSIIGVVALLIYIILAVVCSNTVSFALRILFAVIAAIAFAIKMGIEISNHDSCGSSILIIAFCLFDTVMSTMQLLLSM